MGRTVHRWMPEDVLEMVKRGAELRGISESAYIALCVRALEGGGLRGGLSGGVTPKVNVPRVDVTREPFRD